MDVSHPAEATDAEWVFTTQTAPWRRGELAANGKTGLPDVFVQTGRPQQTIEGFGACFNELGWTALAALDPQARDDILRELFSPGVGGNFTVCRMPVGANDFSREWYSYDEVAGDFALEHFSIANDLASASTRRSRNAATVATTGGTAATPGRCSSTTWETVPAPTCTGTLRCRKAG